LTSTIYHNEKIGNNGTANSKRHGRKIAARQEDNGTAK
jgi:hypothetical protein